MIRPNTIEYPLTQEVKEYEGTVPDPVEDKLYSTERRKCEDSQGFSLIFNSLTFEHHELVIYKPDLYIRVL